MTLKKYNYILILLIVSVFNISAQKLGDFKYKEYRTSSSKPVVTDKQFNGYTDHWQNNYKKWYRTGNLFKISIDHVEADILQSKIDVAQDMGIPGLIMQEGFFYYLNSSTYIYLNQPQESELNRALQKGDALVYVNPESKLGRKLTAGIDNKRKKFKNLKSYQWEAKDLERIDAFYLVNDNGNKLFVISSSHSGSISKFKELLENTTKTVSKYNIYKGLFGASTSYRSVSISPGHPLEFIAKGLNEGNSWIVFGGYYDHYAKDEIERWIGSVNLPLVSDVGFSPIYGCKDYDDFQDRLLTSKELWVNYAHSKGGYVFRDVLDPAAEAYQYDGYFATEGNKEQIDKEKVPFVVKTGQLSDDFLKSMVLFLEKEKKLTKESMWDAILDRREVGILGKGLMVGSSNFRNALQMLLLDRIFLEEYFGDRINIEAITKGYDLQITFNNYYSHSVSGKLNLILPDGLKLKEKNSLTIDLPAGTTKILNFSLLPTVTVMNHVNPIAIYFNWQDKKKSTLAMLDLPPVISVNQLLYGHSPKIIYPVTIHNYSNKISFPVKLSVVSGNKVIYQTTQDCKVSQGSFKDMLFELEVPPGNYNVKVSALEGKVTTQLGVGKADGISHASKIDLNNDGIDEYHLENDSVQVTLLATGARIIEYIVKSRNDNLLFKLWPEKVSDEKRPFRERAFYPYGGFEDFLGQGSMENHQVYNAEIIKSEGDYVRVRMWTDYFGNYLEKTFTLYGNSPLLEVRFALRFKNREANLLGPQPMLALGKRHWTEDVFTIPELDGIHEYRMRPEHRYGMVFQMKEGWNAGYDTKEDITFVGAFPVDQPIFLHMFLNEPGNHDTHYFYGEFQPWVPIISKSTMYFTYYLWGSGGKIDYGIEELKKRNLITITKK